MSTTVDQLLPMRDVPAESKLIALWALSQPVRAFHRDDVCAALGLHNGVCERAVRRLQHPDVAVLEGDDPTIIMMRADHPMRPQSVATSRGKAKAEKEAA